MPPLNKRTPPLEPGEVENAERIEEHERRLGNLDTAFTELVAMLKRVETSLAGIHQELVRIKTPSQAGV